MNPMSIMDIDLGSKESPRTIQKSIPVGVEGSKLSICANFQSSWGLHGPKKGVLGVLEDYEPNVHNGYRLGKQRVTHNHPKKSSQ